jgi:HTH-type transcriptional regulator/antitoxin HigA
VTLGTDEAEAYAKLLASSLPRSITSEEEAEAVQRQINALIDKPEELTEAESELLSLLGDLTLVWEDRKYDLSDIAGPEAVRALLELHGLRQSALVGPVFPTRSLASEVLSGKRQLTYDYVRRLAEFFRVSPAVFYPTAADEHPVPASDH